MMSKALVVDDSKTMRIILGRILKELGYEVCEAGNGKEALKVMESEKAAVSLVLADWNMPEMDGLELLKKLRQDPALASLKVIMVTTETELDHMVSALEAGANAVSYTHLDVYKRQRSPSPSFPAWSSPAAGNDS